ncbi:mitochondrial import inner membrane translocase subunit Tim54 [Cercophora newfieldiana]|uniref:Mitochondrial import inner membrane translocase subunit TIM54 n=1 Tax=Cercophora newfieldiana TaxID=92897 RepID=A0AA39Y1G1_9PEZI|nr:mitochondrial import inner membrane translocase subunit Tim54 [Cercophora newfieldiana]
MADSTSSPSPAPAQPTPKAPKPRNQALRMLGLPALPSKLPSRNWMIFWTVTTTVTATIIYDKREKKRAIARWSHAVEHLAKEPLHNGLGQVRKLTIYLSSPPGDGLRFSQDHYTEYVKPILAASGLDWEFVQGRREGDVRAVVAEKIRKIRRGWEPSSEEEAPTKEPTKEEIVERFRKERGIEDYDGVRGDVVVGRHTWKEYVRGLHEGWLGPLAPPPEPAPLPNIDAQLSSEEKPAEDKPAEEEKPKGPPPQPRPYNTTNDYPAEPLPLLTPGEFAPAAPIREPHILGFLNTPTRMMRFFNRRALADDIGREVAAVCLSTYREFRQEASADAETADQIQYEQRKELAWEEKDWLKSVWKEDEPKEGEQPDTTERIRASPMILDPRIAGRMRRFELLPEDEARARQIVVPEEEIEGWTKGKFRKLYRWGASKFQKQQTVPLTDADVE